MSLTTRLDELDYNNNQTDVITDITRLRNAISNYFQGLQLVKLKQNGVFGVWYAKYSGLTMDEKYIVCICQNCEEDVGTQKLLSELFWISFQTRHLTQPPARGFIEQNCENLITPFLNSKIQRARFDKIKSIYSCSTAPIVVELLHVRECNEDGCSIPLIDEYPEEGTILSAIMTFSCVIRIVL